MAAQHLPANGRKFDCPFADCSYLSPIRGNMLHHFMTHIDLWEYVCGTCGMEFHKKSDLQAHQSNVCLPEDVIAAIVEKKWSNLEMDLAQLAECAKRKFESTKKFGKRSVSRHLEENEALKRRTKRGITRLRTQTLNTLVLVGLW